MNKIVAMMSVSGKAAVLAASLAVFAPAHATVIVDHSNGGSVSGTTWTNSGGTGYTVWDDFTLTNDAMLNGISYYTRNTAATFSGDYRLMIGTSAGQSDVFSTIIANSAATKTTFSGSHSVVDAAFSPLNLSAGTYWLTFNSGANLYGSANVQGASLAQIYNGTSYIRAGSASSFVLTGSNAIPEPGSLALLGLGLLGLAAARRKRSK